MVKLENVCKRCLYHADGGGCRRTVQQKRPYDELAENPSLNFRKDKKSPKQATLDYAFQKASY